MVLLIYKMSREASTRPRMGNNASIAAHAEDQQPNEDINKRFRAIPPVLRTSVANYRGNGVAMKGGRNKYKSGHYNERRDTKRRDLGGNSGQAGRSNQYNVEHTSHAETFARRHRNSGFERASSSRLRSSATLSSAKPSSLYSTPDSSRWPFELKPEVETSATGTISTDYCQTTKLELEDPPPSSTLPYITFKTFAEEGPGAKESHSSPSGDTSTFPPIRQRSESSEVRLDSVDQVPAEASTSLSGAGFITDSRMDDFHYVTIQDNTKQTPPPFSLPKLEEDETSRLLADTASPLSFASMSYAPSARMSPPQPPSDSQPHQITSPLRSDSPVVRAKEETEASFPDSILAFPVTSGSRRYTPLPRDCQQIHNPNYKKARRLWAISEQKALARQFKHLRVTKAIIRDDGMAIDWSSRVPVWPDTLLPANELDTTAYGEDDVIDVDAIIDSNPDGLPTASVSGPSFPVSTAADLPLSLSEHVDGVGPLASTIQRPFLPSGNREERGQLFCAESVQNSSEWQLPPRVPRPLNPGFFGAERHEEEFDVSARSLEFIRRYMQHFRKRGLRPQLRDAYAYDATFSAKVQQKSRSPVYQGHADILFALLQLSDLVPPRRGDEGIAYDIAFCGQGIGAVVIVHDRSPPLFNGLNANSCYEQTFRHSFLLRRREWVTPGEAPADALWPLVVVSHQLTEFIVTGHGQLNTNNLIDNVVGRTRTKHIR